MQRVCKPGGLILLLNMGLPDSRLQQWYYRMNMPVYLLKFGLIPHRPWDKIVDSMEGLEVMQRKKMFGGSIYYQVLRNSK